MKKHKWFDVVNAGGNGNPAEILIYGVIGGGFWDEGVGAKDFIDQLRSLEKNNPVINVRINSPGGSIWEGLPIFNAIQQSSSEVNTYIDGIAYSMGAIIALAGKKVHAAANAMFLLHAPLTFVYGNARDLRTSADDLDKYADSIATAITAKTGLTAQEVKEKWMNYDDHLMTAQEAKDHGLIDIVLDQKGNVPENLASMSPQDLIRFYCEQTEARDEKKGFLQRAFAAFNAITNPDNDRVDVTEQINAMESENAAMRSQLDALNARLAEQDAALEGFESAADLREAYNELCRKPGDEHERLDKEEDSHADSGGTKSFKDVVANMSHYKRAGQTLLK